MTIDFRVLCAEVIEKVEFTWGSGIPEDVKELLNRARSALADEPASVVSEPSDEEIMELWHGSDWYNEGATLREFLSIARAVLARWGNSAPHPPADVSQLSDGYHTFAELYEHRHSLTLALMRAQPHMCWFSRRHADGELPFGSDDWFIVGAELPGAPITYHLPAALYPLAQKTGALELPTGWPWDGHAAADVVQRLRDWAITPPPPADGEVAELVEWLREQLHVCLQAPWTPGIKHFGRAANLLERLSPPQPVPVNERLPGPKDCDGEGRCWWWQPSHPEGGYLEGWMLRPRFWGVGHYDLDDRLTHTHWLPAHAIPIPTAND